MRFRQIAPDVYVASRNFINAYAVVKDGQTVLVDTCEPGTSYTSTAQTRHH
jgi:hypothetical protein